MFVSEERQIAERIKDFIKNKEPSEYYYIMLRNGHILHFDDYRDMVISDKISPQDAYVFIDIEWVISKADFYYPFLYWGIISLVAFLSKLHFHYGDSVVPATGLKYIAITADYSPRNYLSIEVTNLDTVVNNLNLRKIVFEVLGEKLVSGEKELTKDEYEKILGMFKSQQLFAGYTRDNAWNIIHDYYDRGNQSLAKEVTRIAMEYYKIFQPYTVCYETTTWKEIDCSTIT